MFFKDYLNVTYLEQFDFGNNSETISSHFDYMSFNFC